LFAYSSIAHAGYVLVGALALTTSGVQSILFYLFTYLFTNLAAFTVIVVMADRNGIEEISGYRDLGRRSPWLALSMGIALVSLIGVPPMAGFLGKWFLFAAAVRTEDPWCLAAVMVGLVNSLVSVYYYARIIRAMYLEKDDDAPAVNAGPVMVGLASIMAVAVVAIFIVVGPLYNWTGYLTGRLLN